LASASLVVAAPVEPASEGGKIFGLGGGGAGGGGLGGLTGGLGGGFLDGILGPQGAVNQILGTTPEHEGGVFGDDGIVDQFLGNNDDGVTGTAAPGFLDGVLGDNGIVNQILGSSSSSSVDGQGNFLDGVLGPDGIVNQILGGGGLEGNGQGGFLDGILGPNGIVNQIFGGGGSEQLGSGTGLDIASLIASILGGGNGGSAGNGYVAPPVTEGYPGEVIVEPTPTIECEMYPWTPGSDEEFFMYDDTFDIFSRALCSFSMDKKAKSSKFVRSPTAEMMFASWANQKHANFKNISKAQFKKTSQRAAIARATYRAWKKGSFETTNSQCLKIAASKPKTA